MYTKDHALRIGVQESHAFVIVLANYKAMIQLLNGCREDALVVRRHVAAKRPSSDGLSHRSTWTRGKDYLAKPLTQFISSQGTSEDTERFGVLALLDVLRKPASGYILLFLVR